MSLLEDNLQFKLEEDYEALPHVFPALRPGWLWVDALSALCHAFTCLVFAFWPCISTSGKHHVSYSLLDLCLFESSNAVEHIVEDLSQQEGISLVAQA